MWKIFKSKETLALEEAAARDAKLHRSVAEEYSQRLSRNDTSVIDAFQVYCRFHGIDEREV
jgi:hypothetical protein